MKYIFKKTSQRIRFLCFCALLLSSVSVLANTDERILGEDTQDCQANVERTITGFYRMHDRIDKNLDAGDMVQVVFERDYMRLGYLKKDVSNALKNCKKDNPNIDFTTIQEKVDKVNSDYVAVENKFNGVEEAAITSTKTRYHLQEYTPILSQYPTSFVKAIDYEADYVFSRLDAESFLNATDDGSSKYKQDYGPGKKMIATLVHIVQDEDYVEKLYATVDNLMSSINYEKTKKSLDTIVRDFTHMQEVFFPEDENITKFIAYAKQKRSEIKE